MLFDCFLVSKVMVTFFPSISPFNVITALMFSSSSAAGAAPAVDFFVFCVAVFVAVKGDDGSTKEEDKEDDV